MTTLPSLKRRVKIEVYTTEPIKAAIADLCQQKGITLADGLRRAVELWVDHERVRKEGGK